MRDAVTERLRRLRPPGADVAVTLRVRRAVDADRISPAGREQLRVSRLRAAAATRLAPQLLPICMPPAPVACPYCGSRRTTLENAFGPTLCRAIHHCADCRQPFEAFKAV